MDASLQCPEALIMWRTSMPASSRAVIAGARTEWLVYTADRLPILDISWFPMCSFLKQRGSTILGWTRHKNPMDAATKHQS